MVKNKAFTLAEILITLGIIGVIAALTIPSLIQNITNSGLISLYKENYSLLKAAYGSLVTDGAGEISTDLYGGSKNATASAQAIRDALCEKISCVKICNIGEDCYHKTTNDYKNYNGTSQGWGALLGSKNATLKNGAMISVFVANTNFPGSAPVPPNPLYGSGGWINIDTNGFKGPNRMGKDIFRLIIYKNGIEADGVYNDPGYCSKTDTASTNGIGCDALILRGENLP